MPAVSASDRLSEIHESNAQWIAWARRRCGQSPTADLRELPGWSIAWGSGDVALFNTVLLSHPVTNAADLDLRLETLRSFLASKPPQQPPLIALCVDFIPPDLHDRLAQSMAALGLRQTFVSQGMLADQLAPSARALPVIDCRRVHDAESSNILADINSVVHHFPIETGRASMIQSGALLPDFFGYIGYLDDIPVATSVVIPLQGCLQILRVATLPDYRRRGYGEAVMRHSIAAATAATGITRTTLHTTPAGRSMYLQMGYRPVADFRGFSR